MSTARTSQPARERGPLDGARAGDEGAYLRLVEPQRAELHAHCYRMLGSVHDAEDALQEALLRAWRGLARFEGRSSVRSPALQDRDELLPVSSVKSATEETRWIRPASSYSGMDRRDPRPGTARRSDAAERC